ncbi:hypothetical protein ACIBI3_09950 [Actinomadura luteofluorescens]|uniref:hypothetical protein n=1 Tax=Actinomadura luteofluorescens TaxID=46163 RepID=UPI0034705B4D
MTEEKAAEIKRAEIKDGASGAVWPMAGGVLGLAICMAVSALIGGSFPLTLGVALGAVFMIVGLIAGVVFSVWFEDRGQRPRSRKNKAA